MDEAIKRPYASSNVAPGRSLQLLANEKSVWSDDEVDKVTEAS